MHDHWLFTWNVLSHLVASMSGIASFVMSMWEHARNKKIESRVFFVVGVLCLTVAFDQAWQDEHRNSEVLISQKESLASEKNFWQSQYYATSQTLQRRDELLAKNYTALTDEQTSAAKSQTSLAALSQKILDINKPEKQSYGFHFMQWNTKLFTIPGFSGMSQIVITSNQSIMANFDLSCEQPFSVVDARVADGGPEFPESYLKVSPSSWQIRIPNPQVSPQYPVIVTLGYNTASLGSCTFAPNNH